MPQITLPSFSEKISYRVRSALAKFGIRAMSVSGLYSGYWANWRGDLFDYAESAGIHVLPVHYYTPIPTQSDTSRTRRKFSMSGVTLDIQTGLSRASFLLERYQDRITKFLASSKHFDPENSGFHPLDAAILFASVCEERPKRIIEIGSGMSTFVIAAALKDAGLSKTRFTCVEPFLPPYLKTSQENISEIIERPLQDVSLNRFRELDAGDILFIDSTHVVRYGSDVVYEILEILPILKPGVIIHVHDIFFPNDYPDAWLKKHRFFWAEQYLLQAFLSMNPNFKIEIPVYAVRPLLDAEVARQNNGVESCSLWMRRVA